MFGMPADSHATSLDAPGLSNESTATEGRPAAPIARVTPAPPKPNLQAAASRMIAKITPIAAMAVAFPLNRDGRRTTADFSRFLARRTRLDESFVAVLARAVFFFGDV